MSRGDVWLVMPDPAGERAADGAQPCLILSPPEIHDHLGLVIVAPIAERGRAAGFRVPVEFSDRSGVVRLEQLRAIEKRLLTRQVGTLERKALAAALATLREMFAD